MCNGTKFGENRLLTTDEAAAFAGMSPATWRTKRSREPWNLPPATTIGRCVRYLFSDVIPWVEAHREPRPLGLDSRGATRRPRASSDTADMIEVMIATGARIGEVLAFRWADVDLDARRGLICGTIKAATSRGTHWKPLPVSRVVTHPDFAAHILCHRSARETDSPIDAVFPRRNGTWQQVKNVEHRWRQIWSHAGLVWVTPEAFRQRVERRT